MDTPVTNALARKIAKLPGPLLVVGAGGFIGANLLRALGAVRDDVYGTVYTHGSWRLSGLPTWRLLFVNLLDHDSTTSVLERVAPAVVFDCSAYGAYSFEKDVERIHRTNYLAVIAMLEHLAGQPGTMYLHAGTSSEYGLNAAAPSEDAALIPDSHYAVSKAAVAQAITYYGRVRRVPCLNLRLYSAYGPYEDASRLIPVLAEHALRGILPPLVNPDISRDFLYIDDVTEAFVTAALAMRPAIYGASYNIGTGKRTTIRELAHLARDIFAIEAQPVFGSMPARDWDHHDWYANPTKAREELGWQAATDLPEGLRRVTAWWGEFLETHDLAKLSKKKPRPAGKSSVSAIVACYKDGQAIPHMYERLVAVFAKLGMDYEIIFVNDASPDDSSKVIAAISERDPNVIGIVHSRNFGSQAAFRSGLEIANKEACVLLDGDLQDPPELIEQFVEQWRAGADVAYGRRVAREMPGWLEWFYRGFYKLFAALSEFRIPENAGDFSLLDAKVVRAMLHCQERDSFLRGLRAYVGFRQTGVDYVRPERMFGVSTNNWIKNINWAKKAIFSYSRAPLHFLTAIGLATTVFTSFFTVVTITAKLVFPQSAPKGITLLSLLIMVLGSLNLLGLGLLGEYIGKIIEEAKQRPHFVRESLIRGGEVVPWKKEP